VSPAIRPAAAADIPAIAAIYAHHVLHGSATFEEVPPDEAEMARRHAAVTGRGLPYIVAEEAGRVVGYAYAAPYRERSAYRFTLEDSIYLDPAALRRGIGRALLERVVADSTAWGARQMLAVIGDSGNAGSVGLHRSFGFREVGVAEAVGLKFGRWLDTVTMQLALGEGATTIPR
jgi:L-amino acid N-acyltransferase YncA